MVQCKQGGMELYYKYHITNQHGKIRKKSRKLVAHSFLGNFAKFLNVRFTRYPGSLTDVTNVARTVYASDNIMYLHAGAGAVTYGLVVGTDNTAVDINDYNLGALITHGVGGGQLQYSACTIALPSSDATTTTTTVTRVFSNDSGGIVTINEIGIIGGSGTPWLIVRDIPSPIAIGDGEQLTLNYLLQTTV